VRRGVSASTSVSNKGGRLQGVLSALRKCW
jgi:hypothetical protein